MSLAGEVLAEWQARLQLRSLGDAGDGSFVVDEFDGDGDIVPSVSFPHHDLFEAIDEYNARWLVMLDPETAAVAGLGLSMSRAMGAREIELLGSLLSGDYTFTDHRAVGWPALSRAEMLEATPANADTRTRWLTTELYASSHTALVAQGGFWTPSAGSWYEVDAGIFVTLVQGNQLVRTEVFTADQLEPALRRFDELTT